MTCHKTSKVAAGGKNAITLTQGKCAALLGVTREHLNRVLNGARESKSLLRRYRKLTGGAR